MSDKKKITRRISLNAGEEYTLSGNGLIKITLQSGVLDVAGVMLEANRPYRFFLHQDRQSIVVFTLEGGTCLVLSDNKVEMRRDVARAGKLVQMTRRTLLAARRTKILVIGRSGCGKTLAAHTLCNLLIRYGSDKKNVFLLDLNAESNCLYAPGCVSCLQVPGTPLWPGLTASPTLLPLSLYVGAAVRPSASNVNSHLHYYEQLHDMAMSYIQELRSAVEQQQQQQQSSLSLEPSETRSHVVVDAPAPLQDLQEGVWYRKLIEVLRPTHVVIVGSREDNEENWSTFLQEDVQRVLPDCEFLFTDPVAHPCTKSSSRELLREYFNGSAFYSLGCSKVVIPIKSLVFVEEASEGNGLGGMGEVTMQVVHPDASFQNLVCALSHAELVEEAALAPIAGLMTIVYVDEENEEVALLIPAAEEPLQRRIVIVPQTPYRDTLRMTAAQVTAMEEAVAV
jgi:energy-coupling factor transporter ATP-binding protein EcfA2